MKISSDNLRSQLKIALSYFLCFSAVQGLGAHNAWSADPVSITIELNKLEPKDKSCRAYIVVENTNNNTYSAFKLDLILFQPDGVVGKRLAIELAPLKPKKKSVKLFDLDGTPCNAIGSFLLNDIVECKSESGSIEECLSGVTVKSLAEIQLTK